MRCEIVRSLGLFDGLSYLDVYFHSRGCTLTTGKTLVNIDRILVVLATPTCMPLVFSYSHKCPVLQSALCLNTDLSCSHVFVSNTAGNKYICIFVVALISNLKQLKIATTNHRLWPI